MNIVQPQTGSTNPETTVYLIDWPTSFSVVRSKPREKIQKASLHVVPLTCLPIIIPRNPRSRTVVLYIFFFIIGSCKAFAIALFIAHT